MFLSVQIPRFFRYIISTPALQPSILWIESVWFNPKLINRIKEEAVAVSQLSELGEIWKEADVIGIDEGQFYKDVSNK